jgi:two-component system chemotaxis response regulator CheB
MKVYESVRNAATRCLSENGESYLVGDDYTLRNQSRFLVEDKLDYLQALKNAGVEQPIIKRIDNLNSSIGLQPVKSVGAIAAHSRETGKAIFEDYRNIPVLSVYTKLQIKGLNWAILNELDESEALAPAQAGARNAVKAFSAGAVEIIEKPTVDIGPFLTDNAKKLIGAVKTASIANVCPLKRPSTLSSNPWQDNNATVQQPLPTKCKIVAIGSSTGGTVAIESILCQLPLKSPPILIVQHMPGQFTKAFAQRLNSLSELNVKEAKEGDKVEPGTVLISPGDKHMVLKHNTKHYYVQLKDGPPVSRHKPSVDVLFRSVADCAGNNAKGIIMTGMGSDGAKGMLKMRQAGATTLAQDEASCIVYGMPGEAVKLGGVMFDIELDKIAEAVVQFG